jgi:long-chain fatty acid transport protein
MDFNNRGKNYSLIAACGLMSIGLSGQIQAAGFQLIEQSVSSMGTAYAGTAASAYDASTVYFNPAGLTYLSGSQGVAGVHVVAAQADYTDKGSTYVVSGAPIGGGNGGDGGTTGVVPHVYLTHQVSDKLTAGLGINAPFGLATEYDDGWVGRYHAIDSEVMTINVNPSFGYKVNDQISFGAGINYQYIDATLSNAIDFGSIGAISPQGAPLGTVPGAEDGHVEVSGDDWSWGYNLGLMIQATERTRIGVSYRSETKHSLKGDADFTHPANAGIVFLAGAAGLVDTTVNAKIELPATTILSVVHQVNDEWTVMGDISKTSWSSVPEIRFSFDSGASDNVTTLNWNDSTRISLGATFQPENGNLTYRFGIALDETPIPSNDYRTPRIPGEDRLWVALGLGYKMSDRISFDIGYAHLFVDDPEINKVSNLLDEENRFRGNLIGSYDASVDILSAQLSMTF